jgi:hypothetical protein
MTDETKSQGTGPHWRGHGLMGPVMLITIGVLFLIGEYTRYGFGELWPVLLIVAGGVILAQSVGSRSGGAGS